MHLRPVGRLPQRARRRATRIVRRQFALFAGNRLNSFLDQRLVRRWGLAAVIRHTDDFSNVRWLGRPVRQNLADLWTTQEIIIDRGVDLVIECGTYHGGSALFMASLFDLLGRGRVVTIDIKDDGVLPHARIDYLYGSSTSPEIVRAVKGKCEEYQPTELLVLLDSSHAAAHVLDELRTFADLVPVGGYLIVQDGLIDELPMFWEQRPGPLVAIRTFLAEDSRFEVDEERSAKYFYHHSPSGCLRRVR